MMNKLTKNTEKNFDYLPGIKFWLMLCSVCICLHVKGLDQVCVNKKVAHEWFFVSSDIHAEQPRGGSPDLRLYVDSVPVKAYTPVAWSLDVFYNEGGNYFSEEAQQLYDFEVFNERNELHKLEDISLEGFNKFLDVLLKDSLNKGVIQVIFLNRSLNDIWVVSNGRDSVFYDKEEVVMYFDAGESAHYTLHFSVPEVFYFFYVEPSGGIQNLRYIQRHMEKVLEKEQPFLIYYNSPSGGMIINKPEELVNFYNRVFIAITQSPFPADELVKVSSALRTHLSGELHKKNMVASFYIGEISYASLLENFITPLLHNYIKTLGFREVEAVIYTDFDVRRQKEAYKYVNILKNKTP